MELNKIEKILILGYYLFEKRDNIDTFARKLAFLTNSEFNVQNLNYELAKIKLSNQNLGLVDTGDGNEYHELWNEYSSKEKMIALRNSYLIFKRTKIDFKDTNYHIEETYDKDRSYVTKLGVVVKRDPSVLMSALSQANHECEAKCETELFESKKWKCYYTEGHHLIPLKYQSEFVSNLDIVENIVSLCPNCHRKMHYGKNFEEKLLCFYNMKYESLSSKGISISFEELLCMYI